MDYAILSKDYIGYTEFYKMFEVLKNGGYMAVNGFGVLITPKSGYVEVAITHTGEKFDKKVLINMTPDKTPAKKEVIMEAKHVEEVDIFG